MPAVAVAAAAAAASIGTAAALEGAVIAGITISSTVATIIGSVAGLVVATAGSMLLSSMAKKPSVPDTAQDRKQAVRSGIEPHRIVYGRTLVSGPVLYIGSSGTDNEFFHIVVALAGHEVAEIQEVWINDYQINLVPRGSNGSDSLDQAGGEVGGTIRIHAYDGSQTDADPLLMAECPSDWTSAHILAGIAYIYVRIQYDQDRFPSGFQSIAAVLKGKKVYDPRTDTTAWSDNAALCIRDYLVSGYGLACAADEVDDSYIEAAANICDEAVALDSAETMFQARYQLNGSFKLDQTPIDIMEQLISACAGTLIYIQGAYRLQVGAYEPPGVTLTASEFAGPLSVTTRVPRREVFNSVVGTYINPAQKWTAVSFPMVTVDTFLAEDNGEVIQRDVEFPFTTDRAMCQRLARIQLLIARRPVTIEAPFKYGAIRVTAGQTVAITLDEFAWHEKDFRVKSWKFDVNTGIVTLTMQEEYSTNYSWTYLDAGPDLSTPDSGLVNSLDIPAPTGLTVAPTAQVNADGYTVSALLVTWTNGAHPFVTATEIQWKQAGDSAWSSREVARPTNQIIIAPVISGVTYQVRARSVANLVRSAWTSTGTGDGAYDSTAPGVPTDGEVFAQKNGLHVAWTPPSDKDLAAVEVWESTSSDPGGRYYISEGKRGYNRTGIGGGVTLWFWLRSRDLTGNVSAFVGPYSGTSNSFGSTDFASNIAPVGVYAGIPSGAISGINVIVNTLDNKLYRWTGSAWILVIDDAEYIAAAKITGALTDSQIADLAAAKLTGQITTTQITDGAISTPKLAAGSVSTAKIAADAVTASEIATNAITAAKIQAGAVETAKIAAGAVTADKILANEAWFNQLTAGIGSFGGLRATELVADEVVITSSLQVGGSVIGRPQLAANAATKLYSTKANDTITVYGGTTYTALSLTVAVPDTAGRVLIYGMIDLSQSLTLPGGSGGSGDSGNGSAEGGE